MSSHEMPSVYWQEVDFYVILFYLAVRLPLKFSWIMIEKNTNESFPDKRCRFASDCECRYRPYLPEKDYEIKNIYIKSTVLKLFPQIFK